MPALRERLTISQVTSACTFCKARKIKCDGSAPSCSGCRRFGREHTCSLSTTSHGQPVDYHTYLQDRVKSLRAQLEATTGIELESRRSASTAEDRPAIDTLVADIGALPLLVCSYPVSIEGPSLSSLVLGAASGRRQLTAIPSSEPPFLPNFDTAFKLFEHYVRVIYPRQPFFSLQGFCAQFAQVYSEGEPATGDSTLNIEYSYFTVLIVLSISAASLSRSTDSVVSRQSQRLFDEALRFRDSAILPDTMTGVQSLLFLIQCATLNPSDLDAWYLIGVALRNCINLGLHRDPTEVTSPSLLETRRRLWWSVYSYDRSMSIGCGRPTEISDDVIEADLPSFRIESNASDLETQGYLQRYRALRLQSRIYAMLDTEPASLPADTILKLEEDLVTWRSENALEHSGTLLDTEWLMGSMLLYRPCRALPERSTEDLQNLWAAGTGFIALYRQLVADNSIFYTQIACEKAYWTGLGILYAFWKLSSARNSSVAPRAVSLWMAINDVLFVLRTLCDRWEEGKILTTEFDRISSSTINLLEELPNHLDLETILPMQVTAFGQHTSLTSIWRSRENKAGCVRQECGSREALELLVSEI